jgi:hypothetical protein
MDFLEMKYQEEQKMFYCFKWNRFNVWYATAIILKFFIVTTMFIYYLAKYFCL